jgi:hypothetical protein
LAKFLSGLAQPESINKSLAIKCDGTQFNTVFGALLPLFENNKSLESLEMCVCTHIRQNAFHFGSVEAVHNAISRHANLSNPSHFPILGMRN